MKGTRPGEYIVSLIAMKFITLVLALSLLVAFQSVAFSHETSSTAASLVQQTDQAGAALAEGRRLLKRGKADQALGQLQTALKLYTAAKNEHPQ
jgi:hypothetical protein